MSIDPRLLVGGFGVLVILGFVYLFRWQLANFAVQRGITLIQRLAVRAVLAVGDSRHRLPRWVLIKNAHSQGFTIGLLTQLGTHSSTVFIPSGPRLFPGQLLFIKNEHYRDLEVDFEEGLQMTISLGLLPESEEIARKIWSRMEEF